VAIGAAHHETASGGQVTRREHRLQVAAQSRHRHRAVARQRQHAAGRVGGDMQAGAAGQPGDQVHVGGREAQQRIGAEQRGQQTRVAALRRVAQQIVIATERVHGHESAEPTVDQHAAQLFGDRVGHVRHQHPESHVGGLAGGDHRLGIGECRRHRCVQQHRHGLLRGLVHEFEAAATRARQHDEVDAGRQQFVELRGAGADRPLALQRLHGGGIGIVHGCDVAVTAGPDGSDRCATRGPTARQTGTQGRHGRRLPRWRSRSNWPHSTASAVSVRSAWAPLVIGKNPAAASAATSYGISPPSGPSASANGAPRASRSS
jgi:hypothetical protein